MTTILTYVSSEGTNPFTGELFPEGYPKSRTVGEIYGLLCQGFTVKEVQDGINVPLNKIDFYNQFKEEIIGKKTMNEIRTTSVKDVKSNK